MNELKNVDVHLISFVDKAANKRKFIYKSADIKEDDSSINLQKSVPIIKVDDEKRLVYGTVYAPNEDEGDAHEDYMTAAEIEKAAHNFLAKSNTIKATDTQHNLQPVEGVAIVESAVLKGTHEILKDEIPGTWYIVTKVENDEVWKSVKDGTYTGFSLYGFAERVEKAGKRQKSKGKKMMEKFFEALEKTFGESETEPAEDGSAELVKSFDDVYNKMQLNTMVNAISCAIYDVSYNDMLSVEQKIEEIGKVMDDAWAKLETIEIAKAMRADETICKAGKVLSAQNMKNLQSAIEAMQAVLDAAGDVKEKREKFEQEKIKRSKETGPGENTMENITKADHDKAVKELEEKHAVEKADLEKKVTEVTEKNEKLEKEFGELKEAVENLLEKSKGSAQVDDDGNGGGEKVVKFDLLGSEIRKKFNIKD